MKMHRAYKFRLYPTKEQIVLIRKTFGCTRFVYNYYLDLTKRVIELPKLKSVKIREYHCSKCRLEIDRDYNASINILNEGLKCYNN